MFRRTLCALAAAGAASVHAATFTVTNLNNGGPGSLRQAVLDANAAPGADTINFSVSGTIVLTSGQLGITDALTIVGPGAGNLTISGNANSRIFSVFENVADICATPGSDFPVSISGLTLTNGLRNVVSSPGGALYSEKTHADEVVISNSQAFSGGGMQFNARYSGQMLTINNSQFLANTRPLHDDRQLTGAIRVAERCATTTSPVTAHDLQ
jgi:hypothetical protein